VNPVFTSFQFSPPSIDLNTPPGSVPAYKISGF